MEKRLVTHQPMAATLRAFVTTEIIVAGDQPKAAELGAGINCQQRVKGGPARSVTKPLPGAVQVHHPVCPLDTSEINGSLGSLVAPASEDVIERLFPYSGLRLAKLSLAGWASAFGISPVTTPHKKTALLSAFNRPLVFSAISPLEIPPPTPHGVSLQIEGVASRYFSPRPRWPHGFGSKEIHACGMGGLGCVPCPAGLNWALTRVARSGLMSRFTQYYG